MEDNMKAMTVQLKQMSDELVKFMNAMNKSLDETMPQLSKDMSNVISAMKPVADNLQKNIDNFNQEISASLGDFAKPTDKQDTIVNPEEIVVQEVAPQDITAEIDKELAQFELSSTPQGRIKLFPSSVE
jgi:hypothetical protein